MLLINKSYKIGEWGYVEGWMRVKCPKWWGHRESLRETGVLRAP